MRRSVWAVRRIPFSSSPSQRPSLLTGYSRGRGLRGEDTSVRIVCRKRLSKREALADAGLTWHFIGHLQTNKAKKVVENFDWVHSVDRLEAAEALARHVVNRPPLPILVEVKLQDEPNKSGFAESLI